MPYTFVYDDTVPAGSDFLSQGDDAIREFKDAVKERLESFFTGIDIDPLVPKDGSIPGNAIVEGSILGTAFDPALNLKSIILATIQFSGTIAAAAFVLNSYTIVGAEEGDYILVNFVDNPGFLMPMAKVTGTDTVGIALYNNFASGSITLTNAPIQVVIIKPGVPGQLHGNLNPTIPFTEFQPADASVAAVYDIVSVVPATGAALKLYASIGVPPGDVISTASIMVKDDNTAVVTGTLYKVNAGVSTSLGTFTATVGGGAQTLTISPAYTVLTGDEFVFEIILDSTGSTNAYDARLFLASLTLS